MLYQKRSLLRGLQLELVSYESQQDALVKNTEFLLADYPALHVLLYGSRGSGKSSLVKGLLNKYYDSPSGDSFASRGLRLIEVAKSDLKDLPVIVEQLRNLAQKFIIFVDDLSFEEDDDAFKALKVVLEGSVTARSPNVVVYATSNRRHLIREFFGDRPRPSDHDEVHVLLCVSSEGKNANLWISAPTTYLTIILGFGQRLLLTRTFCFFPPSLQA